MRYFELLSEKSLKGSYVGLRFSDQTNKNLFNYCQKLEIPNHLTEFHSTLFMSISTVNDPEPEGMYPITIDNRITRNENIKQGHLGYIPMIKFNNTSIRSRYSSLAAKYPSLTRLRLHVSLAYGLKAPINLTPIDFPLEIIGEYIDARQHPGDARKSMQTV